MICFQIYLETEMKDNLIIGITLLHKNHVATGDLKSFVKSFGSLQNLPWIAN